MKKIGLPITALAILILGAGLQGQWSHRWVSWDVIRSQKAYESLKDLPVNIGEWQGKLLDESALTLPEEIVGRGVTAQFVNLRDGSVVLFYYGYGPTNSICSHPPSVCYPANGYNCLGASVEVPNELLPAGDSFNLDNFSKGDINPTYHRVFWAYSEGANWSVPSNPRRTYRRDPYLFKCYFVRSISSVSEPIEGDPCLRLMHALLPQLKQYKPE